MAFMDWIKGSRAAAGPEDMSRAGRAARDKRSEQDLMVLEDMDNGKEYFLHKLDSFRLLGRTYMCMASYEPETGSHTEPQLVIMRFTEENGQQYFESIRDRKELDTVFDAFYARMEENLNQAKEKQA